MKLYLLINRFFHFLSLVILLTACNDESAFNCIKTTGDIIKKDIVVEDEFHRIEIYDGIDVYLSQGEETSITLKTGENLIKNIEFVFKEESLIISDNNTCNWARTYGQLAVYITANQLKHIKLWGYGDVNSIDTLRFTDLIVESKNGTGDIKLNMQCKSVNVVSNSISNISLTGTVDNLTVGHYYDDGQFHGQNLIAQNVTVNHLGTNTISVYPVRRLKTYIESNGDVYYCNTPEEMVTNIVGSGQLIQQ